MAITLIIPFFEDHLQLFPIAQRFGMDFLAVKRWILLKRSRQYGTSLCSKFMLRERIAMILFRTEVSQFALAD
jgi:hypothetical protein